MRLLQMEAEKAVKADGSLEFPHTQVKTSHGLAYKWGDNYRDANGRRRFPWWVPRERVQTGARSLANGVSSPRTLWRCRSNLTTQHVKPVLEDKWGLEVRSMRGRKRERDGAARAVDSAQKVGRASGHVQCVLGHWHCGAPGSYTLRYLPADGAVRRGVGGSARAGSLPRVLG